MAGNPLFIRSTYHLVGLFARSGMEGFLTRRNRQNSLKMPYPNYFRLELNIYPHKKFAR